MTTNHPTDRLALLEWYLTTFVPDPGRGYTLMNPPGVKKKYTRKQKPRHPEPDLLDGGHDEQERDAPSDDDGPLLTHDVIEQSLSGATRRLPVDGRWRSIPIALAVVPRTRCGVAREAIVDVDYGGQAAVETTLAVCERLGLWAFAQLGVEGPRADGEPPHDGGHVRIPSETPLSADLLRELAERVKQAAGVAGDAFPTGQDVRLPLQLHLRAPGGPQRFPLLLQMGERIPADEPFAALTRLREVTRPNTPEQIVAALAQLPPVPRPPRPKPAHPSKVRPHHARSVITWFNRTFELGDLLDEARRRGRGKGPYLCPFHDDHDPSLAVWAREDGREVCYCHSRSSGCWAAEAPWRDAFDVYCHLHSLTTEEAVRRLAKEHQLGYQHTFVVTSRPEEPAGSARTWEAHQRLLAGARNRLREELARAACRRGWVTAIRATPGLGKTFEGAQQAWQLHRQGTRVAVVVQNHRQAEEWKQAFDTAHQGEVLIWQPKTKICTCNDRDRLVKAARLGYQLPGCREGCPYRAQEAEAEGKIVIFQAQHLFLKKGQRLAGMDVLIVDENPMNALLEEHTATQEDLAGLIDVVATEGDTPLLKLLQALHTVGRSYPRDATASLRGRRLLEQLEDVLDPADDLGDLITKASESPHARQERPLLDAGPLRRQFLYGLVEALTHDYARFVDRHVLAANTLLAFARVVEGSWAWAWYQPQTPLAVLEPDERPAVVVLDGSANKEVLEALFRGWPVDLVTIEVPFSPLVTLIQCPITPSTRKIVRDADQRRRLINQIAATCQHLGLVLDGGVGYKAIVPELERELGGRWLHYGGQRGLNDLKDAATFAIVASPTVPPDALERKAMALWSDDNLIDHTWDRVGRGEYRARDPRLEVMSRLHILEEVDQSLNRPRPVLRDKPITILVFSPYGLADLGLTPHQVVEDMPHGNHRELRQLVKAYRQARRDHGEVVHDSDGVQSGEEEEGDEDPRIDNHPDRVVAAHTAILPVTAADPVEVSTASTPPPSPQPPSPEPSPLSPLPAEESRDDGGDGGQREHGPMSAGEESFAIAPRPTTVFAARPRINLKAKDTWDDDREARAWRYAAERDYHLAEMYAWTVRDSRRRGALLQVLAEHWEAVRHARNQ